MNDLSPLANPKGRPREFCVDKVLGHALTGFWRHGYEGASMAELTAAMGITKPSLYAAFGNKEQLFRQALDLYEREKLAFMGAALDAPTARGVAERLLRGALAMQSSKDDPKGCLAVLGSTACGNEAAGVKAEVAARRASSQAALVRRFDEAKAAGELPEGMEAAALARYLLAIIQGLALQAGAGATPAELAQVVETGLAVWPTK